MTTKASVLVTGGTGFLAKHIIFQLLSQDFNVKTTLRSIGRKHEIEDALTAGGIHDLSLLSFVEADLSSDANWDLATKDCDFVLHTASPLPTRDIKDENELLIPARDGTLRVLRASRNNGVKRVVHTSSFTAIANTMDKRDHVFTEEDWTDVTGAVDPYTKSKTLAESAAWEFIDREGDGMELTVINPTALLGLMLDKHYSGSLGLIKGLIDGEIKKNSAYTTGLVDARDVAAIQIRAMQATAAKGQRFLATAHHSYSFLDIADVIRQHRPELAGKIADLSNDPKPHYLSFSVQKAKDLLNWNPRSAEDAILATVDSLVA